MDGRGGECNQFELLYLDVLRADSIVVPRLSVFFSKRGTISHLFHRK